jgi:hypothetical protein
LKNKPGGSIPLSLKGGKKMRVEKVRYAIGDQVVFVNVGMKVEGTEITRIEVEHSDGLVIITLFKGNMGNSKIPFKTAVTNQATYYH